MESIIVSFLVPHKKNNNNIYIYIYIYSNEVKNHTTRGSQINAPEGEFIEGFCGVDFSLSWVGDRCSPEDLCRALQWLSSVP